MSQITDKELLDLFQNPATERHGFNLIVRNFQERIYWHIRKIVISHDDANDIVQNTFIKAWKGLSSFRGDSKLYTWLYRIATNESITFLKKKRKHNFGNIDDMEEGLITRIEGPFFDGDEIEKKLQEAILTLPTKQRIVFNMRYYEEIKYEEMSLILDTSVGALKASYHHAKNKIEYFLKTN